MKLYLSGELKFIDGGRVVSHISLLAVALKLILSDAVSGIISNLYPNDVAES